MSGTSGKSHTAGDPWIFIAAVMLVGLGILMVFSTTAISASDSFVSSTAFVRKHLLHVFLGSVALYGFSRVAPETLYRLAVPLLFLTLLLLAIVAVPGVGHSAGGARRWLVLGPLRVQPGEIAKLCLLIYFASYIERHKDRMVQFVPGVLVPFLILGAASALLLLEPDFGSTVVIVSCVFGQLFSFVRLRHLCLIGFSAVSIFGLLIFASPYRMKRFLAFLDPFEDPSRSGYQLIQSLIAVGSGGLSGAGLGAGKQKLFYLPAAHTDFIFAVIAEELGLLGALLVIALFLIIFLRGIRVVRMHSSNCFVSSLALGCVLLTVLPAFLNVAVVSGLLPTKGLVLPLVAYGGTAMIVHMGAVGLLLGLSRGEP